MVAAKKPDTFLQAHGLVFAGSDSTTCTPTLTTMDALAVGHTLRAMARTAPASARDALLRVGAQLVSAAQISLASKAVRK